MQPHNTAFAVDENGVLFNKDKTELIYYPVGKTEAKYSIPEGTRKIVDGAFSECLHLKEISLPASLETLSVRRFSLCHRLESISVSEDNPFYSSADGVLFNKEKTILYEYPCQNPRSTYYIPNTVTELADGAFSYCAVWRGSLDDDVKRLNCTLTALYVPSSVKTFSNNFIYDVYAMYVGCIYPIETLTVHCEAGSPVQTYCLENGISCSEWDGKVPMNPDNTKPAETEPTAPSDEKADSTANTDNASVSNTIVDIPKTAGGVNSAAAGAAAMLAFSALIFIHRKKDTTSHKKQ